MVPLPVSPTSLGQPAPTLSPLQLSSSTAQLYADPNPPSRDQLKKKEFHSGPWREARASLDYSYHEVPSKERQLLQDEIVSQVLGEVHEEECKLCDSVQTRPSGSSSPGGSRSSPVALFTSGGMGAGKGHVLRTFLRNGKICLPKDFVWIDPDKLALLLPERAQYLSHNPALTSTLLHPEASLLQELLTSVARSKGRSIVVDGSLSCAEWFEDVMRSLSKDGYGVEILFVFAEEETMRDRAGRREKKTGRRVTDQQIHTSRLSSPRSVRALSSAQNIHRLRLVDNSSDSEPPKVVYDSKDDPEWGANGKEVDVEAYAFAAERGAEGEKVWQQQKL
ncbi:zeta toxin-domain-containing protein [Mrakia frigida]|uniref:zeta toxin-domain-containing protein n=1 Tax=Mrakia frigida TaxID=29902 RepID=UPI003FCC132D